MGSVLTLPILPTEALGGQLDPELEEAEERDPFPAGERHTVFGPKGRWLLDGLLARQRLTRLDEIAILTTSDETYVSTCLSVTAFNYASISRSVTERTKVVIVVHEHGFVFPDLAARVLQWREGRDIYVIEDCAHILSPDVGGIGDVALYSLPKIFPTYVGGFLRSVEPLALPTPSGGEQEFTRSAVDIAERYLAKTWLLNERRLERHQALGAKVATAPYSDSAVPWVTPVRLPSADAVQASIPDVEWVATLRRDVALVPTNPFVSLRRFEQLGLQLADLAKGGDE